MNDLLYSLLTQDDEITWQSIILDLLKTGELDPWDINVSLLAQRYLETIKELHELNLFVSGKIILASAILLKFKSEKLLTEGIQALDNIMFPPDIEDIQEFENNETQTRLIERPTLTIKTPQTRKKRVTITDLISALEKALEVNERRVLKHEEQSQVPESMYIPQKPKDLTELIREVYSKITNYFINKHQLTFTELVGSTNKQDKLYTFLPLLHLDAQGKIELNQTEPFGEIDIQLLQ